ncbi:hypothetical protein D9615_007140 [Tricholomella constricta]|uniref:Meiotically up-regulated gene 152 protein n=1 Tax=Tricholomella constricta TaxID=117010 RepID=A0A8H5M2W2_9AGAR|nr:hypothetical protein D9615_007140 [Tricholomella constricta]
MANASLEATVTSTASDNALQVPSASTFSFKAPFPASSSTFSAASPLKQRRVSLALPSSPRVVQAWNFRDDTGVESHVPETEASRLVPEKRGKMRKLATGADGEPFLEKKQRKKWSDEETKMLVLGCNRHGVGNWKTILSDTTLTFDNRSPVDLKDRFRTYFPDAYKEHYPNARTHLSSKVRSTLPDGSSLFEKTRSKKRRPFTEEEDRALKAGYEKHGTVWATIVKDPVFREQGRRSTDLRDRFRNAFPELYQAAGYKPRNASKKKQLADGASLPVRAATDDQLAMSTTGPVRSRRRAHTSQGLLRGGTKSVPQSTACSEDDDSSAGEEEGDSVFKTPHTPVFVDNVSTSSLRSKKFAPFSTNETFATTDDDEMEMVTFDQLSDSLSIPDFMPNLHPAHSQYPSDGQSQTWSSGINTPTHSNHAWSTAAGSPTSSHLSADYLMSASHSPSLHRRSDSLSGMGMIGKSAWGTQDWFSANPRLDPGSSGNTSSSSYPGRADDPLSPASPFSFHNLNHGVLDRYDLLPTLLHHDFSSEVGVGDTHSTFSDDMFPPSGFRGFTHHSNYAGDLIFGARTHQPQHPHQSYHNSNSYGSGFGFGTAGLGLSGISQSTGIHPMQLALPGIDEIELTGITLDDTNNANGADTGMADDSGGLGLDMPQQPPQQKDESQEPLALMSSSDRFSLDDLVDLSAHDLELHSTPPGTPLLSRPRGTRRSSESTFQNHQGQHGRSISVPPSEPRVQLSLASSSASAVSATRPGQSHTNSQPEMSTVRTGHYFAQERQTPDAHAQDDNGNKVASPMPPQAQSAVATDTARSPPPHSAYPAPMLLPSLSHDAYSWRTMSSGDSNNVNLSFLDLHYYYGHGHAPMGAGAGTSAGVVGSGNGHTGGQQQVGGMCDMNDEAQLRQGQALDLAQSAVLASSSASSSSASLKTLGIPAALRQHIPQEGQAVGADAGLSNGNGHAVSVSGFGAGKRMVGGGAGAVRAHSHHRGQSAVCPQDLVLRSDNKRKRASWDGAHS